jgi:uncharacterized membrane protein YhaH (DUF805 family)
MRDPRRTNRKGYLIAALSLLPSYIGIGILPFSESISIFILLISFLFIQVGLAFLWVERWSDNKVKKLFIFSSIIFIIMSSVFYFLFPREYSLIGIISLVLFYRAINFIGVSDDKSLNNNSGFDKTNNKE